MYDEIYGHVYISECPDCGENEGGYYCQVYKDENHDIEIDNFCIHKEELKLIPTTEFWKMAWACGCYCTVYDALQEIKTKRITREIKISGDNMTEFVGQIIDVFEDFLDSKKIQINNMDKQDAIAYGENADNLAIIYGEDYDRLDDGIRNILKAWSKE